jgi:hypothetical protein
LSSLLYLKYTDVHNLFQDPQLLEKLKPTALKTDEVEAAETEGGSIDSVCSEPSEVKEVSKEV